MVSGMAALLVDVVVQAAIASAIAASVSRRVVVVRIGGNDMETDLGLTPFAIQ